MSYPLLEELSAKRPAPDDALRRASAEGPHVHRLEDQEDHPPRITILATSPTAPPHDTFSLYNWPAKKSLS